MAYVRTFTVTVSGGKYYIDSVQQPTINIAEGGLYKFDLSDSSNNSLNFRFSTTSDGTHSGGSIYTTGVDQSGTPGNADAYLQIQVAASAPDPLYYFDTTTSGMGGQVNTPTAASFGMRAWSINSWGAQNEVTSSLTGLGLTSSIGEVSAFPEQGWGSDSWGTEDWGESGFTITPTGVSATASVGELSAFSQTGWGRDLWGEEPWGDSYDPVITLTGLGLTASLGELTYAQSTSGWGRNAWGDNNWGENTSTVILTAPDSLTASLPAVGWGDQGWSDDAWGGEYFLDPADVVGLTGVSATASVPTYLDIPEQISGLGATSSIGQLSINNGADHVQGLASLAATASPGALAPADVMGLTGISGTISVGSITVASVELIDVTGVGATSSVGSISLADMIVGLSGVAGTSGVGSISPTEMAMGLTGVSATVSVGEVGGPIAWKKVTPTQGGSWSKDSPSQGGSWSKRSA
jgi:hypothetical protein